MQSNTASGTRQSELSSELPPFIICPFVRRPFSCFAGAVEGVLLFPGAKAPLRGFRVQQATTRVALAGRRPGYPGKPSCFLDASSRLSRADEDWNSYAASFSSIAVFWGGRPTAALVLNAICHRAGLKCLMIPRIDLRCGTSYESLCWNSLGVELASVARDASNLSRRREKYAGDPDKNKSALLLVSM